jgi:hypothetical protein
MKFCNGCKEKKPLSAFSKNSAEKDGKQSKCKPCRAELQRQYRTPEINRNFNLKNNYGMTTEIYMLLYNSQEGCCKICGKFGNYPDGIVPRLSTLFVDHDYSTGAVRGLLCNTCNTALGHYEKTIQPNFESVQNYLGQA